MGERGEASEENFNLSPIPTLKPRASKLRIRSINYFMFNFAQDCNSINDLTTYDSESV